VAISLGSLVAGSTEELTVRMVEHNLHQAIAGRLFSQPQTQIAREVTLIWDRTIILQTRVRIGVWIMAVRRKDILEQDRAQAGEDVE
jgi:hypothetical protein